MDTATDTTTASGACPPAVQPLTPVLSARYALTAGQFGVVAAMTLWCWYLSYVPLYHAVTWHHALVGQWMVAHRQLPQVDPTLALADGVAWNSTSWLTDVALALLDRAGGPLALNTALVVLVGGVAALLARLFYVAGQRKRWMIVGLLVVLAFSWTQVGVLRSEFAGAACFAGLLLLLQACRKSAETSASRSLPTWSWVAIPALLALWANVDASVLVGAIVVLAAGLGSAIDACITRRSMPAALNDSHVRNSIWLTELALVATLLNPLGWGLWRQAFAFPTSPLWMQVGGWRPLLLTSWIGLGIAVLGVALAVALRFSRRSFAASELLSLAGLMLLTAFNATFAPWLSVVAVLVLLPHVAAWFDDRGWIAPAKTVELPAEGEPARPFQFAFTLAAGLIVWVAFALSPLATPVLGGKPRSDDRTYARTTPLSVSKFLRENPPRGLVWAPEDWGDWLAWDGPAGLKLAANSNFNALPRIVRSDIVDVARADGNWTRVLDRYGVELLVIDKQRQDRLTDAALSEGDSWTIAFENDEALVLRRKGARS